VRKRSEAKVNRCVKRMKNEEEEKKQTSNSSLPN
jgi:hypothetical protein